MSGGAVPAGAGKTYGCVIQQHGPCHSSHRGQHWPPTAAAFSSPKHFTLREHLHPIYLCLLQTYQKEMTCLCTGPFPSLYFPAQESPVSTWVLSIRGGGSRICRGLFPCRKPNMSIRLELCRGAGMPSMSRPGPPTLPG